MDWSVRMSSWTVGDARRAMRTAPFVAFEALCGRAGAVAVIAPHPDDETLGCGGLIALAAERGRRVVVLLLTDGEASHPESRTHPPARLAALRCGEARAALDVLTAGAATLERFAAPDGRLADRVDDASAWLAQRLAVHSATSAFVTWEADPHPDHRAAHVAAAAAAHVTGVTLWSYPVWGLTAPPDRPAGRRGAWARLDVRTASSRKAAAIARHASQTTDLIADDPSGFRLTPDDLARHLTGAEAFLSVGAARAHVADGARSSRTSTAPSVT